MKKSRCTNPELGVLLHAYELDILSEEEIERFEIHLLECEHCFKEFERFEKVAYILKFRFQIAEIFKKSQVGIPDRIKGFLKELWRNIWPETSLVFKPALAYLLILLMIIPTYIGVTKLVRSENKSIQVEFLASDRSGSGDIFKIKPNSRFEIGFRFDGARVGQTYRLVVESGVHKVVVQNDNYDGFNEKGCGFLELPVSKMKTGNYSLVITDPRTGNWQEYFFQVKK